MWQKTITCWILELVHSFLAENCVDLGASLVAQLVKNLPAMWETWVWSLGWEDPLEKGKATHSSILPLESHGHIVHGVAKSWTRLSDFHFHFFTGASSVRNLPVNAGDIGSIPGSGRSPDEGNGKSLQYCCLESSMDRGAWQAIVHGVAKSWTRLND